MKKVLSFILATAMILSMIIVVSIPTTAADGEWITYDEWQKAATANQLGIATEQQKEWLKNGHRKA